ncbi:hypothetical protein GCM10011529_16080 [Polymorphobacter glacialis]|uniref:Porin n=1 Tax=Sandarakinorhabdus glacialis TaxID=1614636 RepID=A0A916ZRG9_9SPHN|nr:hypothetical protein GCM10011529_16080 [Polymorphobacter glacialis]
MLAAGTTKAPTKPVKQRFSFETPVTPFQSPVSDASKFSFTAAGTGASSARLQTVERAFRFTPSGQSDNRKALSLGVNTRMTAATPDRSRAVVPTETLAALPTAYDVDLTVAWKGFAINTGFSRAEPAPTALLAGRREAVDIGVSYRGRNWQTSLQGIAEESQLLSFAPIERRYSVELEGAYSVAPRLSVTGGVRYKLAPTVPSLLDIDAADRSVYFGTNFAF